LLPASKQDAGLAAFEILERTAPSNQFLDRRRRRTKRSDRARRQHPRQAIRDKMQPHLMRRSMTGLVDRDDGEPMQRRRARLYVVTTSTSRAPNRDRSSWP